ncbi:phosphatidylserine/phosphatidylglycerophosphate/cardiolipin synthase family protein [Streptomyces sp. NPDC058664]|uniref:phospholipase D-like domain-containing protein n=1 Tax=unclassified Streptomyces TaxID=2593676 RepID=UPI0036462F9F
MSGREPSLSGATAATATGGPADERIHRIRRRLERLIGVAATEGNAVRPLRDGDEIFATMPDAIGSRPTERNPLDRMSGAGVEIAWFRRPLPLSPLKRNHRCHRKVLVVDERTAFTGGVGVAEEWCGDARDPDEWRDTRVEVQGPAVDGIAAAFAQNWAECHTELFDERDRFVSRRPSGNAVVQVVRGSAGFGWQDLQTLMRAKAMSMDGVVSLIGSTDFDRRSLDHDEEVMLAVMDAEFTATIDADYDEDLEVGELIDPDRRKRRSLLQRARETAVLPIRRSP